MTPEPRPLSPLPLLKASADAPVIEGYRVTPRDDLRWVADRPLLERLRFNAEAYPSFSQGPTQRNPRLANQLDLPAGYNPRTLEWAADLRRDPRYANADARTLAQALLQHIRTSGFSYTLTPGDYGRDGIDEIWLDRR